ncbi:PP2C family protein-serine/threonine phosphatase [Leptospira bandrabouensis]|uniref:PP2C family protein-serine/threonine phosphatase n=1 Tax=Leptospira bandrabouensis TaxID=2484903 RepID=UPI001EE9ADF4|nr:PP2C family protein-serine/threonine phosphatase [Leptospira bandrabouensis]MCG6145419.1 SpoIIE family protein phosphatase [Leptospira bandrabouensis]MCG6161043.1 SpoIIE family protein phosphatase [Leptospira bandrabouensis]MCG6164833.1 SpoIIE family protein phosphatase [Leptospira bandrabouensis]
MLGANGRSIIGKLKKILSEFVSSVLGSTDRFVMRHRILNGTLLAGIVAMGVGLSSEFFREGFEMGGLIALWMAFGFACVFYYLARFRHLFQILILPTFIISSLTAFLQIKYSGGIVSANVMLLAPILVLNMLILGNKYDWIAIVFFVCALFVVNSVQNIHPEWFYDYSSEKARSEDFLITGVSILFLLGLMLRTLNRSYEDAIGEVSRLKYQQDGDYYLTSLLTRPLSGIRIRSKSVLFQTYIKQKKSFQFKNREYELGGDICVADQIVLRGRSYCVFANGDAMGKSMQGAGGVLVFGTAFRALIERTHREGILSGYFPERWLHTALNDFNDIFEGFDGSMSMSLLLGLVDEENGFLYYINAEHPFPIRFREGKASFLSEKATNFKLGMQKDKALIETCWIRPGDTIIIGSDGRDDLSIGFDSKSNRVINMDHTSILTQVEESDGDIEKLGLRLQNIGELTDDLSLLSIRFQPQTTIDIKTRESGLEEPIRLIQRNNFPEALNLLKNYADSYAYDPAVWKLLYRVYRKLEKPIEAGKAAEIFSNNHPSGLQMILEGAIQYAKASLIDEAIDMAERIYSRKPDVIPVIKILVRLYKKSNRPERASEYEEEIHRLENDSLDS